MFYELTTLRGGVLSAPALAAGARAWCADPAALGHVLGYWRSDIGRLGELMVLRAFEAEADLWQERRRAERSLDPFHSRDCAQELVMEAYAGFPFLPPAQTPEPKGVFEFRTYLLRPGGLPRTLSAWEKAVEPAKQYSRHLVVNMYGLDGPPRITHLWQFDSVDQRIALRADHYARGLWPPQGGPEEIIEGRSTIAFAQL